MVRTIAWVLALGAMGLMPAIASAQVETDREYRARTVREYETTRAGAFGPQAGNWELLLSGSGNNDHDFDNGAFSIFGQVGYYLTDDLMVAGRQSIGFASTTGEIVDPITEETITTGDDVWVAATSAAINYHFNLGAFRPFVGWSAGWTYGDSSIPCRFFTGPEAGVKWYVKDDTFIYAQGQYQWLCRERFKDGFFAYSVGIGVNF